MDHKSSPTLTEVLQSASVFLEQAGMDGNLARTYWLMTFDWTLTELVRQLRAEVLPDQLARYQTVLQRIIAHEPIQYILGYADFMGERFKVTPDTLIPREDSAGLVVMANDYLAKNPTARVLDIGTGTGILAISIAKNNASAQVSAVDLSAAALTVAKENAQLHGTELAFYQGDGCAPLPVGQRYEVIVSNPPYISRAERELMDESVKRYEPELALFAEQDGLAFYQQLAQELPERIQPQGMILLEIGFRQGQAVLALFQRAFPQAEITILPDLNAQDRYVKIQLGKESS